MKRASRVAGAVVLASVALLGAQVLASGHRTGSQEVLPSLADPTSGIATPSRPTPPGTSPPSPPSLPTSRPARPNQPTAPTSGPASGTSASKDPAGSDAPNPGAATAATRGTGHSAGVVPLIRVGVAAPTTGAGGAPPVYASVQTDPFPNAEAGDWADDSAIWRNPAHPERSFVLADNKAENGGVAVFNLQGRLVHYVKAGKIGNIDLRSNVRVGSRSVTLVGANDRTDDTMRFWALDPASGALTALSGGTQKTLANNYGFCLGRTANGARTYAFVSNETDGTVDQYELALAAGRVAAAKVRTLAIGSLTEGCAVDDLRGAVYFGQEDAAIWRYALDPATGSARTPIDTVGSGHLAADIEGIAVARGARGAVLVVSSQGNSTFAVYDLDGGHAFRGNFSVGDSAGVDGVSHTDGLDVGAGGFGPAYPHGLLVVHDAAPRNAVCSNLKLVRFDQVFAL